MNELYSKDRIEYFHTHYEAIPSEHNWDASSEKTSLIDDAKFKELLLSMPQRDQISHNNRSFKIAKNHDSLRITFFDFEKRSNHRFNKHQLEKKLSIMRFIIKFDATNFYVSTIKFGNRKRTKDIKQNFIRYSHVKIFAHRMARLLIADALDIHDHDVSPKNNVMSLQLQSEVAKISSILFDELKASTTEKAMKLPTNIHDIEGYFTDLLMGVILEWFCRKNNIKVDYFWLTKLISTQYVTKRQLKKYDNNYLKAFLDYYKLTPAAVPYIKDNMQNFMTHTYDFSTLSVYEKLFPKTDNYFFNFESTAIASTTTAANSLLAYRIYLATIFKLYDPKERVEFEKFLNYLSDNRKYFQIYPVVNNCAHLSAFIRSIAKLYRLGLAFKFDYLPDFMVNPKKMVQLTEAVDALANNANSFVVQHYTKKYKSKVESAFTLYGTKWSLKLHAKTTFNSGENYGDFIIHNTTALLTDVKSGDIIELTVVNPDSKHYLQMIVDENSLRKYSTPRSDDPIVIDMEKLGYKDFTGQWFQQFLTFSGKPKTIARKAPSDSSGTLWALRKVFGVFAKNCRYFGVGNQIISPILQKTIQSDEFLNKYTYIKP